MSYTFLEHPAEIKIKVQSSTLPRAFNDLSRAFSEVISRGEKVQKVLTRKILIREENIERLVYAFIEELIYLLEVKKFIVGDIKVTVLEGTLRGELYGENLKRFKGLDHIKAATYSEMHVRKNRKGTYEIQVVLDV